MPYGWEGNRKSAVALAIRLKSFTIYTLKDKERARNGKKAPTGLLLHPHGGMGHTLLLHCPNWSDRFSPCDVKAYSGVERTRRMGVEENVVPAQLSKLRRALAWE